MHAEILRLSDLTDRDLGAWDALAAAAVVPNPFHEPGFVVPAARGLGVDDVAILAVRDGTDWLAALPVREVRSWRGVPGRCLASWRHMYSFLETPLVSGTELERTLSALVERAIGTYPSLVLDWIDASGPVGEALTSAFATAGRQFTIEEFERAAIYGVSGSQPAPEPMSPRHRNNLRRKFRRLQDEAGQLAFGDLGADPLGPDRFLALERSGWKGRAGTAMACSDGHARFFRDLCEHLRDQGRLELLTLGNGERTVAMMCNLLSSRQAFTFKIAFDEQVAKYSPGTHLQLAFIERFHEQDLTFADSCADSSNETLNWLWPARRRLRSVVVAPRGVTSAAPLAKWSLAVGAASLRTRLRAELETRRSRSSAGAPI